MKIAIVFTQAVEKKYISIGSDTEKKKKKTNQKNNCLNVLRKNKIHTISWIMT